MVFKGYVTNLGKYNEGSLIGEWVEFPIEEDDFDEVLERIGIGEEYEEYFFTDYDYSDCPNLEFGEYESYKSLNDIAEQIESLDKWDMEKLNAIVEAWGAREIVIDFDLDEYNLYSDVNSDYDLGYYWIEESGCFDLGAMGNLAYYIDYEKYGRDVALGNCGCFTSYGYIERC